MYLRRSTDGIANESSNGDSNRVVAAADHSVVDQAYKLFYHSKCEGFYGRGMVPLAMLKHSGVEFSIHAPDEVPAGGVLSS